MNDPLEVNPSQDELRAALRQITQSEERVISLKTLLEEELRELRRTNHILTNHLKNSASTATINIDQYTHLLKFLPRIQLEHLISNHPKFMKDINFFKRPGCWIWTGYTQQADTPFGPDSVTGKRRPIRLILFERFFGEILKNRYLRGNPECGEKACVNPFHTMTALEFLKVLEENGLEIGETPFAILDHNAYDKFRPWVDLDIPENPTVVSIEETFLQRSLRLAREDD